MNERERMGKRGEKGQVGDSWTGVERGCSRGDGDGGKNGKKDSDKVTGGKGAGVESRENRKQVDKWEEE